MSRVHRVSKAEIERVVDALQARGVSVGRVVLEPGGNVIILPGKPEATMSPLERARAERDRRAS